MISFQVGWAGTALVTLVAILALGAALALTGAFFVAATLFDVVRPLVADLAEAGAGDGDAEVFEDILYGRGREWAVEVVGGGRV